MSKTQKRAELRRDMRRVIANLDRRWILAASHKISLHLKQLLESTIAHDIEHLLAWIPFFPGEIDLSSFIGEQLEARKVYLPRILPDYRMEFISIGDDWAYSMTGGSFGIPEPTHQQGEVFKLEWAGNTAVVVPGLAFDREGNRLGRGKGYYDRFLGQAAMAHATKIGICWELQVVDELPIESHDIAMDYICHERDVLATLVGYDEGLEE